MEVVGDGACVGGGCGAGVRDPTTDAALGVGFSINAWDALSDEGKEGRARDILVQVQATGARIIFMAAQRRVQNV